MNEGSNPSTPVFWITGLFRIGPFCIATSDVFYDLLVCLGVLVFWGLKVMLDWKRGKFEGANQVTEFRYMIYKPIINHLRVFELGWSIAPTVIVFGISVWSLPIAQLADQVFENGFHTNAESEAPGSPESEAPGSPESEAPGSPESEAPGSPERAGSAEDRGKIVQVGLGKKKREQVISESAYAELQMGASARLARFKAEQPEEYDRIMLKNWERGFVLVDYLWGKECSIKKGSLSTSEAVNLCEELFKALGYYKKYYDLGLPWSETMGDSDESVERTPVEEKDTANAMAAEVGSACEEAKDKGEEVDIFYRAAEAVSEASKQVEAALECVALAAKEGNEVAEGVGEAKESVREALELLREATQKSKEATVRLAEATEKASKAGQKGLEAAEKRGSARERVRVASEKVRDAVAKVVEAQQKVEGLEGAGTFRVGARGKVLLALEHHFATKMTSESYRIESCKGLNGQKELLCKVFMEYGYDPSYLAMDYLRLLEDLGAYAPELDEYLMGKVNHLVYKWDIVDGLGQYYKWKSEHREVYRDDEVPVLVKDWDNKGHIPLDPWLDMYEFVDAEMEMGSRARLARFKAEHPEDYKKVLLKNREHGLELVDYLWGKECSIKKGSLSTSGDVHLCEELFRERGYHKDYYYSVIQKLKEEELNEGCKEGLSNVERVLDYSQQMYNQFLSLFGSTVDAQLEQLEKELAEEGSPGVVDCKDSVRGIVVTEQGGHEPVEVADELKGARGNVLRAFEHQIKARQASYEGTKDICKPYEGTEEEVICKVCLRFRYSGLTLAKEYLALLEREGAKAPLLDEFLGTVAEDIVHWWLGYQWEGVWPNWKELFVKLDPDRLFARTPKTPVKLKSSIEEYREMIALQTSYLNPFCDDYRLDTHFADAEMEMGSRARLARFKAEHPERYAKLQSELEKEGRELFDYLWFVPCSIEKGNTYVKTHDCRWCEYYLMSLGWHRVYYDDKFHDAMECNVDKKRFKEKYGLDGSLYRMQQEAKSKMFSELEKGPLYRAMVREEDEEGNTYVYVDGKKVRVEEEESGSNEEESGSKEEK